MQRLQRLLKKKQLGFHFQIYLNRLDDSETRADLVLENNSI